MRRADRDRIRAELPGHLDRLANALSLARGALGGPDPEAALGFLAVLDEHLHGVPGIEVAIRAVRGTIARPENPMLWPVVENLERAEGDPRHAIAYLLMARAALSTVIDAQDAERSAA